ncbi:glycine betaine ABC transporter substrate-binding protein [Caldalkalibacillus salinus]|uniref:glycine betaine ABC transporter substrate-binding protein n=1 Tax=Caldalkalibacillus salinus TaxID=2803787 RepID=UPI001F1843F4|nr:glycine betaine ABC transporter substrate-binding protein [Caldalkalibacillus salinus]
MNRLKLHRYFVLLLLFTVVLAGCGAGEEAPGTDDEGLQEGEGEAQQLTIARNNWAENVAVSAMWEILLEEQGYEVDVQAMEKSPVWVATAQGDVDIAPEVWLPHTDEPLYEEFGEQLELHETWYDNTTLGLAVPEYMDINSIEELNEKKDELGVDRIIGIDPGASLTQLTQETIQEYGLEYELVTSSEAAMIGQLESAYNNEENIVVTLWSPHWVFSEYDLKYLEDPNLVYGEPDDIYYATRQGFAEDHPEVVEWMNNWKMDDDTLGELMTMINESSPEEGARTWIEENRDLVDQWIQ